MPQETSLLPKEYNEINWLEILNLWFYRLSVIVIISTLFIYLGVFYYQINLTKKIRTNEAKFLEIFGEERKNKYEELKNFSGQLKKIEKLSKEHIYASEIFSFIDSLTLPQVAFSSFNFDYNASKIKMSGRAANYSVLGRQINLLESSSDKIENVQASGINLDKANGSVNFNFEIKFKPSIFKK